MGLRQLREARGLTQTELAKRTGIAQTVISEYEHGKRNIRLMSLDNALKLSRALMCRPDELVDGTPE
ncbi:helix-turn-helix domain-containing protein [Bifidobacterium pullorum]|uniref:helix-turn-helix domain-containing protein n=1 Tax=Bifidobacterium pullorum TaxID=78448 RepID=UPI0024AD0D3D|nr:helix-turn-helix transcriptional regulator [Bifidobacterium pullorum]